MNTTAYSTADHRHEADCRCPDDRCAGYHHEVGATCWCSIFTGQPTDALDDDRRDIAVLGDLDAKQLNRLALRNRGKNPFEVSGDAIARHEFEVQS